MAVTPDCVAQIPRIFLILASVCRHIGVGNKGLHSALKETKMTINTPARLALRDASAAAKPVNVVTGTPVFRTIGLFSVKEPN